VRYYHIQGRVKTYESFYDKIIEKNYSHPKEMIDFAGLRVICYLVQDKAIISGLLKDNFKIEKEEDKSLNLGVGKIGYNAIHLDALLKDDRSILPEYNFYKDLKFEIQITTVLQHTYAEIEHDLLYKSGIILPENIENSIKKTSVDLETLDERFEEIMKDIDNHIRSVNTNIEEGKLDVIIDSPYLRRYLLKKFGDLPGFKPQYGSVDDSFVIDQLFAMGINTLEDLEKIIPPNFKQRYVNARIPEPKYGIFATGLLVWFLIILDQKKYFKLAYKPSYGIFTSHDYRVLEEFGVDLLELPSDIFDCD
jgi:ppGpp synthetase/RelA/SpoT-type nucleotidyltranferase